MLICVIWCKNIFVILCGDIFVIWCIIMIIVKWGRSIILLEITR